jgi:hypothetical protein
MPALWYNTRRHDAVHGSAALLTLHAVRWRGGKVLPALPHRMIDYFFAGRGTNHPCHASARLRVHRTATVLCHLPGVPMALAAACGCA